MLWKGRCTEADTCCTDSSEQKNSYIIYPFRTIRSFLLTQTEWKCYLCDKDGSMSKQLYISRGTETVYLPLDQILYFEADGNYTSVKTNDGRERVFTYQLGEIAKMIQRILGKDGFRLVRVGRSLIVNLEYVHVIDIAEQVLAISDCAGQYHELSASQEALKELAAMKNDLINKGIL